MHLYKSTDHYKENHSIELVTNLYFRFYEKYHSFTISSSLAQLWRNKIFVKIRIQVKSSSKCTLFASARSKSNWIFTNLCCVVQGFVLGLDNLYRIIKIFQDTLDSISEKHLSQFGRLYFHQGSELKYRILSYLLGLDEQ